MESTNNTPYDKIYKTMRQAKSIECLHNNRRVTIKLTPSHKLVYSYMLSMFNYYSITGKQCILSADRVCAEVDISESTYKRIKKDFIEGGIAYFDKTKTKYTPSKMTYFVDVLESPSHKFIQNDRLQALYKKRADRMLLLTHLQLVGETCKSWSKVQAKNYWRNSCYEEVTGFYFNEDKTEGILYDVDDYFTRLEELKDYEIATLLG